MRRILITSIPRSGSTMLFRAIADLGGGSTTPADYAGPHLKAHSFDPEAFVGRVDAAVFLFGDVISSVVSTRERRWTAEHFANCGAPELSPETADIFNTDCLNFERMFDAWSKAGPIPHACVRYEQLHELAPALSELLGSPIALPKKHRRRTKPNKLDPEVRAAIKAAYAPLVRKVKRAPDLQWFS